MKPNNHVKYSCPNYHIAAGGNFRGCLLDYDKGPKELRCIDGNIMTCDYKDDVRVKKIRGAIRVLKSEDLVGSLSAREPLLTKNGFNKNIANRLSNSMDLYVEDKYETATHYVPKFKELLEVHEKSKSGEKVKGFGKKQLLALEVILKDEGLID